MANGRGLRWETDSVYTERQVYSVLKRLGLRVESETDAVYLTYCPFHSNRDTPSFAISKTEGLFICYNPSCARTGNFTQLIKRVGNVDDIGAKRMILKAKSSNDEVLTQLESMVEPQETFAEYRHPLRPDYWREVRRDFWRYAEPQLYMKGRGFDKETMEYFDIGYDTDIDMVTVPVHDPMGHNVVGAVRRSIEGKVFKNTPGLPTSKGMFNIHRAKRTGDTCVIVEASFSAMRLHQCGYPNGVSVLMGHFSKEHASLINKYFNTIIIMTDDDEIQFYTNCPKCRRENLNICRGHYPGEDLGNKIANLMSHKNILWAHSGEASRFPKGIKDPDDMDDELIRYCIKNAVPHLDYALDL